jgi:dihydropteroate synthase
LGEFVAGHYRLPLDRVHLMGILNVNDDSFCGDGSLEPKQLLDQAQRLVDDGADILDVGGESARTNREPIAEAEEIRRIVPVIEAIGSELPEVPISINTWRPAVAQAGLAAGAAILNDMGGDAEGANAAMAANHGAGLVIMHLRGEPKQPHTHTTYTDVVMEVRDALAGRIAAAQNAGVRQPSLLVDPGLDFAKQCDDNLRLIGGLDEIASLGCALLLANSRKTFIGEILGRPALERDWGTLAVSLWAAEHGANFLRVHNVAIHRDALAVWKASRTEFDATSPAK